ncbi:MAG: prepilin peptidase [Caulobacter sp.]|nr:prepilin peptidase [Caulobacter sp.]
MIAPGLLALGLMAGAAAGSCGATVAVRATRGEQALTGGSRCDGCGRTLGFARTVPLVSFVFQRGACAYCAAPIARIHFVGEALGVLAAGSAFAIADPVRALPLAVLGLALLASALVDASTRRLPDVLTLLVVVMAVALAAMRSPFDLGLGVGIGAATLAGLWLLREGFRRLRGRDALGLGDVKLIAALAIWLGPATPWMMAAAGVFGLVAMAVAKPKDGRLAFGPAIAAAAWSVGLAMEAGLWPSV